jgi:hypothetical protein
MKLQPVWVGLIVVVLVLGWVALMLWALAW